MNVSEFKAFFNGLTATGTDGSLSPKQVTALIKAVEELEDTPGFHIPRPAPGQFSWSEFPVKGPTC